MRREYDRRFDAFVDSTRDRAYRTAFAVTRDAEAARLALQAAYADAYAGWRQLRRQENREVELRRLLVQRLLTRPGRPLVPTPRAEAPDEQVVDVDTVWSALKEVSTEHRLLLVMAHYENLSLEDMAAACGMSREAGQARLAEAMSALRQVLIAPAKPTRQRV